MPPALQGCSPFLRRNPGSLPPVRVQSPHGACTVSMGMVWKEKPPENQTRSCSMAWVIPPPCSPPTVPTCPLEEASLNGSGIQLRRATGPTTWMSMMRIRTLAASLTWAPVRTNSALTCCPGGLREEVASFLSFYCKSPAPLKPENVVVLNGCASLFSALATVLCEVGEAFLIPAPYYGAITQHVYLYGNVRLVCVYLDSEVTGLETHPFQLTVDKLEMALQGAISEGVKVKGLILINPQNPLGDIYSPGELREYLEFAKRHALHVMVDEVYMLSVFEESVGYRSVLSLEGLPDPQKTHVMWATSKDFGMSGLRFGTLYTENQDVATAVASLCRYHGLSGFVQYQMAQLLRDRDWINQVYLPENHARLKAAHTYVSEELRALGVPFLSHGAGFFIWVDLRKFLPEATFEEERLLWRRFLENKVLLSFGKAFECKEPGWFRLVFSDKAHRLRLGMQRIRQVLEGKSQVAEDPPSCQTQEPRGPHR
ncbi:1-aminocyclopropane-1-carboxylate synthase-like protein 1 isoform X3 [Camelus dromedarius]|uniref:1-aminocyclopropane-1-carboxylate synthase-like protein 1 isoform X3 n=2 Tax=Camelus dromedarius TaxID=9838 RepID=UPI003119A124